jgi:hypothetical protein
MSRECPLLQTRLRGSPPGDAWVGATYCNGTSNEWVGCENNRGPETVTTTNPCWCPETSRTVLFSDASVLANVVSLPTATGESLDWQGGFLPTNTEPISTGSSSGGSGSSGSSDATSTVETTITQATTSNGTPTTATSVISTAINTNENNSAGSSSSDSSSSSSLSTGAKVGIGIGAGLGFLLLLALLIWFFLRRRKSRMQRGTTTEKSTGFESDLQTPPTQGVARFSNGQPPLQGAAAANAASGAGPTGRWYDNHASAPAALGHKPELDAVGTAMVTPTTPSPRTDKFGNPLPEVEGSPAVGAGGRPLGNGGWEMPGHSDMGTLYEMPSSRN